MMSEIGIGYSNKGVPPPPLIVLLYPTMQVLVEDAMYVSQGNIPMYGGDAEYKWICDWILSLPHGLINQ